jgi:hypothetical protein
MLRAIFLPELKRSLIQNGIATGGVVVLVSVVQYAIVALDVQEKTTQRLGGTTDLVVDSLFWLLLIASAFFAGGAAFARINERHTPFLLALPLSRRSAWQAIFGAHALSGIVAASLVFVLRPSLWRQFTAGLLAGVSVYGLTIGIVLFAAGCCFVMLFRNLLLAATAGGIVTSGALLMTWLLARSVDFGLWNTRDRVWGIPLFDADLKLWVSGCVLLTVIFLALSRTFFAKSELTQVKSRLRNWGFVATGLAAYVLVLCVSIEANLFANTRDVYTTYEASPDGKYLAVIEHPFHSVYSDVTFVDVQSGEATGRYRGTAVDYVTWIDSSMVAVISSQTPLWRLAFFLPPSNTVTRVSTKGQLLDRTRFPFSEVAVLSWREGNLFVGAIRSGTVRLLVLDKKGETRELLTVPMKNRRIRFDLENSEFVFSIESVGNGLEQSWKITPTEVKEIPYSKNDPVKANAEFLFDDGWYSPQAAIKEFAKRFPLDSEIESRGGKNEVIASYLVPSTERFVSNDWWMAVLTKKQSHKRELLAFSSKNKGWKVLTELEPLDPRFLVGPLLSYARFHYWVADRFAIIPLKGSTLLYDAVTEKSEEIKDINCVRPTFKDGAHNLIAFECARNAFLYRRGNKPTSLPVPTSNISYWPLNITESGTRIYRTWPAGVVNRIDSTGRVQQLWPRAH